MQNREMFAGLKVVELASVLAGPNVGQFFAELGAEVIKVENLRAGGDITRTWRGKNEAESEVSAYFSSVNWGKKSLAVDISKEEGKDIVQRLLAKSDVIIGSYKPGDAEKLGVDYETISRENPSVIYGQVTGYGSENDRVGYDAVIQAESGFMDLNGEPDGLPLKMPVALVDVLAAHHLKEGILLAMIKRQTSGKGELVEVSLIQAAISSLTNQATNWLVANNLPKRQGSAHPNIAPYGDNYLTQDKKRVLLAIGSDQQFQNLCKVLNLNKIDSNPLFTSNSQRVNNRDELNLALQEGMSKIEASDLISRCNHLKIPAGIIQNLAEVFEMTEAREILINGPEFMGVRNIIGLNGHKRPDISHILPPPKFGEHSHSILNQDLGFSAEKVALLSQNRVIN